MIKSLVYLSIIFAMIGNPSVLSIDLNFVQISPFRFILPILITMILVDIKKNKRINLNSYNWDNYYVKFIIFWLLYSFISLLWIQDTIGWLKGFFYLLVGVTATLVYTKYFNSTEDILKALRSVFLMTFIHNLIGWYEIITDHYMFLNPIRIGSYSYRNYPVSTFGNTNNYATFLFMSIWIIFVCMMNSRRTSSKVIYFGTLLSTLLLLLFTGSRANILATIVSFGIYFVFSFNKKTTRLQIRTIFIIVIILIVLNPRVITEIIGVFNSVLSFDSPENNRKNLIKNGLYFLSSTLGLGVGAGNNDYWMRNYAIHKVTVVNMHNWFMEVLTTYGIFIFTLYITAYIKIVIRSYKNYINSSDFIDRTVSFAVFCGLGGFIISSVSSSSLMGFEWFWVLKAITIAYFASFKKKRRAETLQEHPSHKFDIQASWNRRLF